MCRRLCQVPNRPSLARTRVPSRVRGGSRSLPRAAGEGAQSAAAAAPRRAAATSVPANESFQSDRLNVGSCWRQTEVLASARGSPTPVNLLGDN